MDRFRSELNAYRTPGDPLSWYELTGGEKVAYNCAASERGIGEIEIDTIDQSAVDAILENIDITVWSFAIYSNEQINAINIAAATFALWPLSLENTGSETAEIVQECKTP